MKKLIMTSAMFLFTPSNVLATPPDFDFGSDSDNIFFQIVIYLGFTLLLLYLFFWLLGKKNKLIKNNLFNHLGGIPLGQNKSVQIVEIGNKIYILGIGENVNTINVLEDDRDIQAVTENINNLNNNKNILVGSLKGKLFKRKGNNVNQFEAELAEKIEQLKGKRATTVNQWLDETTEKMGKRDQDEQI